MRQVADINPVSPPTGKPLVPWVAFGTAAVLVILLLGASHQYLARFQRPYSFEAQSEPTIEIIEATVVLETDAKPALRNQVGRAATAGKNSSTGSQVSEKVLAPNASERFSKLPVSNAAPKVTRFTLSNGIRVVNLYVENSADVGIFSYLPLGLVTDGKAKAQWSHLVNYLTIRTAVLLTTTQVTQRQRLTVCAWSSSVIRIHGRRVWSYTLNGYPDYLFQQKVSLRHARTPCPRLTMLKRILATHKFAHAAWNQVFRHGETDIAMRDDIQSAQLSELQEYRDLHLVQADRVLLCVIGGVDPETLRQTMEEQLGAISLPEKTLPQSKVSPEIAKDQNATWDINVTHYMETYEIPRPENGDYPALYMASVLCG